MSNAINVPFVHQLLGSVIVTGTFVPKEHASSSGPGNDAYIDEMTVVLDGPDPRDVTDVLLALPPSHGSLAMVEKSVLSGLQ